MSLPSGPKICTNAASSNFSAAATSASAACFVVSNPSAPEGTDAAVLVAECCGTAAMETANHIDATAHAILSVLENIPFAAVDLILLSYVRESGIMADYLRRPPPP